MRPRTSTPQRRALLLELGSPSTSILGRRSVALIPWVVTAICSFALALGQALRPAGGEAYPWAPTAIIVAAIAFGVAAIAGVVVQDTPFGERSRGELRTYLFAVAAVIVGISVVAVVDRGLATVVFTSAILLAPYIGLVFPRRWSVGSLGLVLAATALVEVVRPEAKAIEVLDVFALEVAGWFVGVLARSAHRRAARQALLLSRSDSLTGILNRRGFLEQLGDELRRGGAGGDAISLLVIDLNGFKQINDREGHAAGDELLAWVGARVPGVLPDDAGFGRLGGDEFAVVLPGTAGSAASRIGAEIHAALAERVGASIGIATRPDGATDAEGLLQAADAALYAAKGDPLRRVQAVGAPAAVVRAEPATATTGRSAVLTFAQLRRAGGPPRGFDLQMIGGQVVAAGYLTIALSGAVFVIATYLSDGDSFWRDLIEYGGPPWVLANLLCGAWYAVKGIVGTRVPPFAYASSVFLVGTGVVTAALSTGSGVVSPIIAGLYLKALFDASLFEKRLANGSLGVLFACWAIGLAFGPSASLWAAPLEATLLVGAYFLGSIGREAFEDATATRLELAARDGLTGLLNRQGFTERAGRELAKAGQDGATPLAVIVFDLDDFKSVNDTYGHDAGDQLLRAVASAAVDTLPGAHAVGRLGGDEFVAAIPADAPRQVVELVALLDERLAPLAAGSIGHAVSGTDGDDLDTLLSVADHRAYAVKQSRVAVRLEVERQRELDD